eukprot:COSAG04_NODE_8385_length_983_cov_1.149321_1_plen_231_part_01
MPVDGVAGEKVQTGRRAEKELANAIQHSRVQDALRLLEKVAHAGDPVALGTLINAKNERGSPALVSAATRGHLDVVRFLVRAGAKLEATNSGGVTALMVAAWEGKHGCVEFLLGAGADVHAADKYGDNALHYAAIRGELDIMLLLLNKGVDWTQQNKAGKTALKLAQEKGHIKAASNGMTALMKEALMGNHDCIKVLLAMGADVHAKDEGGWTALINAAFSGKHDAVERLL